MTYSVIITAYKEPELISRAIEAVILSNNQIINDIQLVLVCGDDLTYLSAEGTLQRNYFNNYVLLQDSAEGKPKALNLAFSKATGDIWVLTDGDVYLSKDAVAIIVKAFDDVSVLGVTGQIKSLDSKSTFFGYYSNLFCDGANIYRKIKQEHNEFFPLSGYLYAIRKNAELVLPLELRADDDYISHLIYKPEGKFLYFKDAVCYVNFPKNINDLIKQKTRSLGGTIQNKKFFNNNSRSILQDIKMFLFPLFYAQNIKELLFSFLIYPLRLYMWLVIYYYYVTNSYKTGLWERIESSKY